MANSTAIGSGKPCLFMDLGKQAKDLLHKGFSAGHMLLFSYVTSDGATLSTTALITQGIMVGTVSSSFKNAGVRTELSASTLNQVTAGTIYEDLAPGLKLSLTTEIPNPSNLGKAQLVYQHDSAAVTATMQGFKTRPSLECTANIGSEMLSLGGSIQYDTESNIFTDAAAGLGYTTPGISAALMYSQKNEKSINAYCSQEINPNCLWGVHVNRQLEKNISTATVGGLYKVDVLTTIKARVDNRGMVGAVLQYEPNPFVTLGFCAEVNAGALKTEKLNMGFTLSVLAA